MQKTPVTPHHIPRGLAAAAALAIVPGAALSPAIARAATPRTATVPGATATPNTTATPATASNRKAGDTVSSPAARVRAVNASCARRPATCSRDAARQITSATLGAAGDSASDVTHLQQALYAAGVKYVTINGTYDRATRLGVENYQYNHALPVSGRVDAATLRALVAGSAAVHSGTAYLPSSFAPHSRVDWKTSQQVMVARYVRGTTGTWARYQWTGGTTGWVDVSAPNTLVAFGVHGVKAGTLRHNGDGTTPLGTYRIVHTFGLRNPGSGMVYHTLTRCTWWDDVPGAHYNRMVEACKGLRRGSQMMKSKVQFQQGAVPAFNYDHPSRITGPGSGTGILLHYGRGRATDGCVGVRSVQEITDTVAWLDSSQSPMLVTTR